MYSITVGPSAQSVIQVKTQVPAAIHCFCFFTHDADGSICSFYPPKINHHLFCLVDKAEHLIVKEDDDTLMVTLTYGESDSETELT